MRLIHLAAIGLAGAVGLAAQTAKPSRDWAVHGHDAGAQRYSPLDQINTGNVSRLRLAWTYDTPAAVPVPLPTTPPPEIQIDNDPSAGNPGSGGRAAGAGSNPRPTPRQSASTPLVVDGVMYMATAYNRIVALDAETGKEIWV